MNVEGRKRRCEHGPQREGADRYTVGPDRLAPDVREEKWALPAERARRDAVAERERGVPSVGRRREGANPSGRRRRFEKKRPLGPRGLAKASKDDFERGFRGSLRGVAAGSRHVGRPPGAPV